MKQHTETIAPVNFTSLSYCRKRPNNNTLTGATLKNILFKKQYLHIFSATLGIGALFLLSIYFFLSQLAKYGWS